MKTSFDLSEPLLSEVKALAKARGTTTRSLVEQALQRLLDEAAEPTEFVLADGSFGSGGFTPEFANATWEQIRDESYPMPKLQLGEQ
ncbi:MAG: DUF2191 domain-containing protein [Jatrophihabitantaceae bacterium]